MRNMKKKYVSPELTVVEADGTGVLLVGSDIQMGGTESDGVAEVHERDLFTEDIWDNSLNNMWDD